jgi:predicted esterase
MIRLERLRVYLPLALGLAALGCLPAQNDSPPVVSGKGPAILSTAPQTSKPAKPLTLGVPSVPSMEWKGKDLSKADPDALKAMATRFASENNPSEAARFQYWAVKSGAGGEYNLACWTALAGDVDGAFYWLQEAALGDGADADWAANDSDLVSLRKDPRWKQVLLFLKQSNAYWKASGHHRTLLVLPEGYTKGTPIGVVIGLHGLGDKPDGYANPETYQPFANELNMAILGVSGTVPNGQRSFAWSENAKLDAAQIRRALEEVADRLTVKPGSLITFGFSQGGQMGFEVAFQNPDDFKGAIVMSPGIVTRSVDLTKITPSDKNKAQGYVCLCGAEESPGNVAYTKQDAEFAQKAGARVEMKLYEGVDKHAFPPDFAASFVRWVRFIDGSGSEMKKE